MSSWHLGSMKRRASPEWLQRRLLTQLTRSRTAGLMDDSADGEIVAGLVVSEEFADECPVGGGAGGAALVAAGIAIDLHRWEMMRGDGG